MLAQVQVEIRVWISLCNHWLWEDTLPADGEGGLFCFVLLSFGKAVMSLLQDSSLSCLQKNCLRGNTSRLGQHLKQLGLLQKYQFAFLVQFSWWTKEICFVREYMILLYEGFPFSWYKGKGSVCQRGRCDWS